MTDKETTRSLKRWNPFEEFEYERIPARWSRLFGEGEPLRSRFAPSLDISEDDQRYVVTVELPGTKREDIIVELKDQVLTIRGEKRNEREENKEHSRWIERSYGSFSRSFTLPGNAAADRVKAEFNNGVLTVEVPKAEEAKPKTISIK